MPVLLILAPVAPLALALLLLARPLRPAVRWLVPLAPLAALAVALMGPPPEPVRLDWLLLGTELGLTDTGRVFLIFTAILWICAGWQAVHMMRTDPARDRFMACFLVAMSGNIGLLISQDMASFYTFFSAMSLSAWGLVLHGGGTAQRFAGKIYIGFAVLGELALFAGLALGGFATGLTSLAAMTQPEVPPLALALAAFGCLVKLGTVPVHLWLPLAHSAAPAPASAVLSGAMLKAGLFGLITVLPLGSQALPELGMLLAAVSVAGLVLAPLLGVVQGDAKAALAYSSIGQTSLMTLAIAAALIVPETWGLVLPAVVLAVVHHGFAKSALFLGVPAVWASATSGARAVVLVLMAAPALALAGLPGTSGFEAKTAIETSLTAATEGLGRWMAWVAPLMVISGLGTSLLMIRALALLQKAPARVMSPWVGSPFGLAVGAAMVGPWLVPGLQLPAKGPVAADLLPILGAAALALGTTVVLRLAGMRLQPHTTGLSLSVVARDTSAAPLRLLSGRRRSGRPLAPPKRAVVHTQPELGGLAILGAVAAMALLVAMISGT